MNVVDQYSDPAYGTLLKQVSRMPGLEEFVKSASLESKEAEELPESAFAWPEARKFPVHTPEHAALSYAYAKVASVLPAGVETRIKQALEVYGVPEALFEETKVAAAIDSEDDFLIPDLKLFRVKSAAEVKQAEQKLLANLSKLDLEHRAIACGNLVKKADEHQVQLHPAVMKLAGFVVSSTKMAQDYLEARVNALPESAKTYKLAYQTLADGLKGRGAELRNRDGLLKLAGAIADLDEQSGLDRHYDRRLPDALQTVFNTEKIASETVDLGGVMVPTSKLASLPASFWEDLGGAELSNELAPGGHVDQSKLATVLETLPLDLKLILRKHLRM